MHWVFFSIVSKRGEGPERTHDAMLSLSSISGHAGRGLVDLVPCQ